jgi:hypothetical protein
MLVPLAGGAASAHRRRLPLVCNRRFFFEAAVWPPPSGTRPTAARQFATNPEDWGQGKGLSKRTLCPAVLPLLPDYGFSQKRLQAKQFSGQRGPRWRAQLPGGSNWDSGRPGGARGGHAASWLGPRARCRGAHETASPELGGDHFLSS